MLRKHQFLIAGLIFCCITGLWAGVALVRQTVQQKRDREQIEKLRHGIDTLEWARQSAIRGIELDKEIAELTKPKVDPEWTEQTKRDVHDLEEIERWAWSLKKELEALEAKVEN